MTKQTRKRRERVNAIIPVLIDYEVIEGDCGMCGGYIILNRATDLGNSSFAIGREAQCDRCGETLRVSMDSAHPPYELMLFQAKAAKLGKRYMQCVTSLAQALEMFISLYVYYVFLFRPATSTNDVDLSEVRKLEELIDQRMKNMTLEPLRNLLMKLVVLRLAPQDVPSARIWASEINGLAKASPSDDVIAAIGDEAIREQVIKLKKSRLPQYRNAVLHGYGHRPSATEADALERETTALLAEIFPLLMDSAHIHAFTQKFGSGA